MGAYKQKMLEEMEDEDHANTNKNMMVKERISLLKSILKGEEYDG